MPKRRFMGIPLPVLVGVTVLMLALGVIGLISGALGSAILGDVGLPDWLIVEQPHPELAPEEITNLFGLPITNTIIGAWISMAVLGIVAYAATRRLKLVPSRLQTFLEAVVGWLLDFCQGIAGEKNGRRFFPIVATIFLFVITNAWLNLIPGYGSILITNSHDETVHLLRGANTDINLPLALALVSFVFVEFYGIKTLGLFRYMGKFLNTRRFLAAVRQLFKGRVKEGFGGLFNGAIDIFVGFIELLSELVRIIAFTFRLFGNMTGGEILLLSMLFLSPFILAIPFYGLELLVGFIQALIFSGLTLVFVVMAITPHAEHVEEGH